MASIHEELSLLRQKVHEELSLLRQELSLLRQELSLLRQEVQELKILNHLASHSVFQPTSSPPSPMNARQSPSLQLSGDMASIHEELSLLRQEVQELKILLKILLNHLASHSVFQPTSSPPSPMNARQSPSLQLSGDMASIREEWSLLRQEVQELKILLKILLNHLLHTPCFSPRRRHHRQ